MRVDGIEITSTMARALLMIPRYARYVTTMQCMGCKMIQKNVNTRDRHKEGCPVARVDELLYQQAMIAATGDSNGA